MSEQAHLLTAFLELQKALSFLSEIILKNTHLVGRLDHFALSPSLQNQLALREEAIAAIHQLEYQDGQACREILIPPGFLGASEETILAASAVNTKKEHFKQAVLALKQGKIPLVKCSMLQELFENTLPSRTVETNMKLRKYGLARLHLKQCYRHLQILPTAPQYISWTWAHTRAIKRIKEEEARACLLKKGNDSGILEQIAKLDQLNPTEELAILQELAPHLRANIRFLDKYGQEQWKMINGSLPILFPATSNTQYPDFKIIKNKQGKDLRRKSRIDTKLEPTPYLPAIHAHRYLPAFRPSTEH